jgi:hypothetical protein|tara:strand:+ start:2878 stop:4359 length:1482 start_codon:yes stop_codon:yes gene_type:complete
MARSISTKPATVKSKTQNPYTQPCFATYACEHSVYGCGYILFDHNLEAIGKYVGDGNYHQNQFRTYTSYSPEFWNNYAGSAYMETQGHAGSSENYGSNTCNNGYLGHMGHYSVTEFAKTAGYNRGWPSAHNYNAYGFRDVNSIVGDINQDWAWFTDRDGSGHRMLFGQRSAAKYYQNRVREGMNMVNVPIQSQEGPTSSTGTTDNRFYGGSCINTRANRVCLMQTDGSGYKQPIVYNNVKMDWRAYALHNNHFAGTTEASAAKSDSDSKIYQFFNNSANYTAYDRANHSNAASYSGSGESYWRTQSCICDNGMVYTFSMTPGNGCSFEKWNTDGTYAGVQWNGTWTTSYGYEQGHRFGSRWQVSSDGEYWWAYCPSYYYGAGIYFAVVRVSDGKWLYFQSNDSTHGRSLAPLGKHKMVYTYSTNKDNPGTYYRIMDFDYEFRRRPNGDNIGDWDSNYSAYLLDTAGNSTGYPFIIPAMYNTSLFTSQLESNVE